MFVDITTRSPLRMAQATAQHPGPVALSEAEESIRQPHRPNRTEQGEVKNSSPRLGMTQPTCSSSAG